MLPYTEHAASIYHLNQNNDWLRRWQGLALPILLSTTPEARKYFFSEIRNFSTLAARNKQAKINYSLFAQKWNQTADGTSRFYVTTEVLIAYAKSWEKASNTSASKEIIQDKITAIQQSGIAFAAPDIPIPDSLTGIASSSHPTQGVIDLDGIAPIPASLSTDLPISKSAVPNPLPSQYHGNTGSSSPNSQQVASQQAQTIIIEAHIPAQARSASAATGPTSSLTQSDQEGPDLTVEPE